MNTVLWGVLAYLVVQFGIGIYVSRRIRTESDYIVAGRRLGYGLTTFTIFATWFGAETTIGSAGAVYQSGLSGATSDPFGYGVCLFLMGLIFAVPLWRRKLTTLADLFRDRYSPGVEKLAVLLMVPASLLWAAAQIRAFGQVLSASSDLGVTITITVAAAIVIAYTAFGGMLADAWTDLVQGIVLIIGLVVLFGAMMYQTGLEPFLAIPSARLDPFSQGASPLAILEEWAIPICGSVVAAELVSRVISARSPEIARRSSLFAGSGYLLFGLIPVGVGLAGSVLLPGLQHPEQILPLLGQRFLPGALYIIVAGALISAILSTVDTTLLVCSSLVSHNIIVAARPQMSEAARVRVARAGVATFGIVAYVIALHAEGVYALVQEASSFGSAGIFTVVTLGLFTRWGGALAAAASLVAGVTAWIAGAYIADLAFPYLVSLLAAIGAYAAVALGTHRRNPEMVNATSRSYI
ncbi:MAG: sodium:solute symporter family protein [Gemmatimonadota bacterium]|nr:sodium:solute symporter family protein [Gemmatimonadota bacterium]